MNGSDRRAGTTWFPLGTEKFSLQNTSSTRQQKQTRTYDNVSARSLLSQLHPPPHTQIQSLKNSSNQIHLSLSLSLSHTHALKTTMAKYSLSILSHLILLLLLPLSLSSPNPIPNSNSNSQSPLTAHAELTSHGFPIGLLPTNVQAYTLNATTGDFAVHLGDNCRVTLPPDNYLATYSKRITGKIVEGRIAEISGIRVRAFFQWWSITGIRSNGDDLVFEVGVVTAKYPSNNFDEIPECEGKRSAS